MYFNCCIHANLVVLIIIQMYSDVGTSSRNCVCLHNYRYKDELAMSVTNIRKCSIRYIIDLQCDLLCC